MARSCKAASTLSGHLTKEQKEGRIEQEKKLKGSDDNINPSEYLSDRQKEIFKRIVNDLKESGILGNLDVYVLETTVIAIDRLQQIENMINEDPDTISNSKIMSAKKQYTSDLWRGCNELSLSPQSRAKLGNLNVQAKNAQEDELLSILKG